MIIIRRKVRFVSYSIINSNCNVPRDVNNIVGWPVQSILLINYVTKFELTVSRCYDWLSNNNSQTILKIFKCTFDMLFCLIIGKIQTTQSMCKI